MAGIKLLLSDVDGTLVTRDKRLTDAARAAVKRLDESGIAFTVTSSRPPFGLRMLVEPLGLTLPIGAFNGGALVAPDMSVIEERFIPADASALAIDLLRKAGVGIWVFADNKWLVTDPDGDYVDHERRTVQADAVAVRDFDAYLGRAGKIVGVSHDFDKLAACEVEVQTALGHRAVALRSQHYYLDVMPPGVDKGGVVEALSRHLGIEASAIATIGDMDNDVPMFAKSGFSIAMGNATDAVKARASVVTASNEEDGFAKAVERYILGGAG